MISIGLRLVGLPQWAHRTGNIAWSLVLSVLDVELIGRCPALWQFLRYRPVRVRCPSGQLGQSLAGR